MPNTNYDYLQQHPLIEIINIHWGTEDVTLNWLWELTQESPGGDFGGSCSPPTLINPGSGQITGYVTTLRPTDASHQPNPDWTESAAPGEPSTVSFGAAQFETVFISIDGGAFAQNVNKSGSGAGSMDFQIFGLPLNGEEGCYFRPDGNPDVGVYGVASTFTGFPATNTGKIVTLTWPSISIHNSETNQTWTRFRYHVSGLSRAIQLQLTYFEHEQD